ncbi:LysR family transcriptional regulator [Oribacterium sp. HCP28S3_H8]|jgi:DNA-binding transcriptional LysR family regulator|uniref:LysR family transcriptional regulator n=1 Tax=Oribacterium sp. HCP28S3_H8 TaxID=3438945 RepID=UPI003F88729F
MEIRQLNSFVKIVELQSFSKAAEALGYTQAAVTIQIRQLEQEFSTKFFDRVGKHVELTPPGKEFLIYANEILRKVDDVHTALGNPKLQEHKLTIGTLESLLSYKFPAIIKYFYENYPEVSLEVKTGSPQELTDMMDHNQVDIAYFLDRRIYDNNWIKVQEEAEPVVFVAAPDADIVHETDIHLSDLVHQPFFLTEKNSNYRYALEQTLAAERMSIRPFFETGDTEVIIHLIRENKALSFLPYFAVEDSIRRGELRELKVRDFDVTMYRQVFYHKDKWVTNEMREFMNLSSMGLL